MQPKTVVLVHSSTHISGVHTFITTVGKALMCAGATVVIAILGEGAECRNALGCVQLRDASHDVVYKAADLLERMPEPGLVLFNTGPCVKWVPEDYGACRKFVVHGLMDEKLMPPEGQDFHQVLCLSDTAMGFISAPRKAQIANVVCVDAFSPERLPRKLEKVLVADLRNAPLYLGKLMAACSMLGLYCTVAGQGYGTVQSIRAPWEMKALYNSADLVVGYGRVAFEAMACGRPVLCYGVNGGDGYLGLGSLPHSMKSNCSGWGVRAMPEPGLVGVDDFLHQLKKYRPQHGAFVREHMVEKADVRKHIKTILG